MTRNTRTMELANFVCRFGESRVLLDLAEEIVIPAFTEGLQRDYGRVKYFFHQANLVRLSENETPVLAIIGRFIKDTQIGREQVFDEETQSLIKDPVQIESSPSAIFVLILNNHRLIYFHETAYAPPLGAFASTIRDFIRRKYTEYIDSLHPTIVPTVSREELFQEYQPNIEIVSVASSASLGEFVNRFDLIKKVEIQLADTNAEIESDGFFEALREQKNRIHAHTTILRHDNPEGLSKEVIISGVESALAQGSTKVKLTGIDRRGNQVTGDNNKFKISVSLREISTDLPQAAVELYKNFQELVSQGVLQGKRKNQ